MRGQGFKAIRADDVIQMRQPKRVPPQAFQQVAHGAIVGDRIELGLDPFEPIGPRRIGPKHPTQVKRRLQAFLLHIVKALVIGLQDINLGIGNRPAVSGQDAALDQHRLAFLIQTDT